MYSRQNIKRSTSALDIVVIVEDIAEPVDFANSKVPSTVWYGYWLRNSNGSDSLGNIAPRHEI